MKLISRTLQELYTRKLVAFVCILMANKFGLFSQSTWIRKKPIRPTESQNVYQIIFAPEFLLISKEIEIFFAFFKKIGNLLKLLDYMHLKSYCSYKHWIWVTLSWSILLKVDCGIWVFRSCCVLDILKQCDMGFGLCYLKVYWGTWWSWQ